MRRLRARRAERRALVEAAAEARRDAFFGPLLAAMEADGAAGDEPDLPETDLPETDLPETDPLSTRDPLCDPDHDWYHEDAPCAVLLAAELGIDPGTGEVLTPGVAALMQGATAGQWCTTLDRRHVAWSSYGA